MVCIESVRQFLRAHFLAVTAFSKSVFTSVRQLESFVTIQPCALDA